MFIDVFIWLYSFFMQEYTLEKKRFSVNYIFSKWTNPQNTDQINSRILYITLIFLGRRG